MSRAAAGPGTFFDLVQRQRAHRAYREDPVDDEIVARVLTAATFAPSSENHQPWVFVVVRDPGRRAAIGDLMRDVWLGGGRDYTMGTAESRIFEDVDQAIDGGGFAGAPVLVVVGGDTELVAKRWMASSVFPAVQNLLLAALDEGLASALTTIAALRAEELRAIVDFPATIEPLAVVPLGWPARALGPARRIAFAEKTSRDRYGNRW
jgi:nitroreductase